VSESRGVRARVAVATSTRHLERAASDSVGIVRADSMFDWFFFSNHCVNGMQWDEETAPVHPTGVFSRFGTSAWFPRYVI